MNTSATTTSALNKHKLLFVVHSLQMGGVERLVVQLAKSLESDFQIGICCLDGQGVLWDQCVARNYQMFNLDRKPGWHLETFTKMRNVIRDFSPDLIHAHQYTPFLYSATAKLLSFSKARLIFTEHGRNVPDVVSRPRRYANRLLTLLANEVTAVSEFSKRALRDNEGISFKPIDVIYNGLWTKDDTPSGVSLHQELNLTSDTKIVGTIGSLRSVKNPLLLLHAFSKVCSDRPDTVLVFIGDGPLRKKLEDQTAKLGLLEKVHVLGERSSAQRYLSEFSVFVLPSLSEAASLALLEAMSHATPVIVTDGGGSPELVDYGKCGQIVESNNPEALATALKRLLDDDQLRASLGRNAKLRVEQYFTFERMLSQYRSLYERAC